MDDAEKVIVDYPEIIFDRIFSLCFGMVNVPFALRTSYSFGRDGEGVHCVSGDLSVPCAYAHWFVNTLSFKDRGFHDNHHGSSGYRRYTNHVGIALEFDRKWNQKNPQS